jgi:hypothetical protein
VSQADPTITRRRDAQEIPQAEVVTIVRASVLRALRWRLLVSSGALGPTRCNPVVRALEGNSPAGRQNIWGTAACWAHRPWCLIPSIKAGEMTVCTHARVTGDTRKVPRRARRLGGPADEMAAPVSELRCPAT